MGSLKPSVRSKAVQPTIVSNGNGHHHRHHHLGTDALSEGLNAFRTDAFDPDSYVQARCQTMSEKGIRTLCSELVKLKKASAEEMRRSVYANYSAFIRTSREISDLEGELLAMRNLLSNQASLIHDLAEGGQLDSLPEVCDIETEDGKYPINNQMLPEGGKHFHLLLDTLDILIAERRIDEALDALLEGEKLVVSLSDKDTAAWLQKSISERKERLRELLIEIARQPSTRGSELRTAIAALYKLGDGPCAHTLLLTAHSQRLQNNMQGLRAYGNAYTGSYSSALSQLVFSSISQAAKDSLSVFGKEAQYMSELVLWASEETKKFASIVKRHVLSSAAAAGGLRAAGESVRVALGHCSLLEVQGLALCPALLKLFRPDVEQALQANLTHIEGCVSVLAAADDWVVYSASGSRSGSKNQVYEGLIQFKLSSSAHRFQMLIQDFLDDVAPLANLQLGGLMLDGLGQLFESYIELLMMAVPGQVDDVLIAQMDNKTVKLAETENQQLGLLANASTLAEEILPRAVTKLLPAQHSSSKEPLTKRALEKPNAELREWKRRWQRMADKLRDHYCMQQVLDLIFPEDGDSKFSFYSYLDLDNDGARLEPLPSQLFQQLFFKLNSLSYVAADVLTGRERMTQMLLMKLVETFVIFIFDDQDFWEEMENGPKPIGQIGLQQFLLDMQFVIQTASYGRYLSRHMRAVVGDIITRAVEAFRRTEVDPNNVLPENDWFVAIAQDSVHKLLEWSRGDLGSPTASVSAQSMSSAPSHGSP